jgi:hypothetical protein
MRILILTLLCAKRNSIRFHVLLRDKNGPGYFTQIDDCCQIGRLTTEVAGWFTDVTALVVNSLMVRFCILRFVERDEPLGVKSELV